MARCLLLVGALLLLACQFAGSAEVPENAAWINLGGEQEFDPERSTYMLQVGERPLVYYFKNFLSKAEIAHMISIAAPQMRRSMVSDQKTGEGVVDNIRTSYGMFIRRLYDPIIEGIERRISLVTQTPMSHQEDIQVLRYVKGQNYGAHYDSGDHKNDVGPTFRMYTFYLYLSDVEEGGETAFPEQSKWADPSFGEKLKGNGWSDCAKGHVAAKPKAGDAALFWSFFRNGTMDPASLHTGCPVIKGIKWGAPIWVHSDEFNPTDFYQSMRMRPERNANPGMCEDRHKECESWAKSGECERNKPFMIGNADGMGACRKSCKACEDCRRDDLECINRNRKRYGYLELDPKEMEWLGADVSRDY